MENHFSEKFTTAQVASGVASTIFGAGIVTLPRSAGEAIGTPDVWMSLLFGGTICIALGIVCAKLCQRYPGLTFYDYSSQVTGKLIGSVLTICFVIYCLLVATYELRMNAEVVRHYLLQRTPIEFTTFCFMLISVYLVLGGLNPIVRLLELLLPVTTIVLFVVMLLGYRNFELENLRPLLSEGISPVLKGLHSTATPFIGFETILFFTAFMRTSRDASKAVVVGIAIPIMIYLCTLLIVIGTLSVQAVKTLTWPTIEVIRSIEFPGAFFTNFEILFITVWVIEMFTTFVVFYFLASLGMNQLFRTPIKYFHYGFFPVVYFLSFYPSNLDEAFQLGDIVGYLAMVFAGAIPLILLIISYLKDGSRVEK
ncbi:GerAB/ArcD/ProY family transporter [Brevibacillus migulae]|uniref:GerAB/ArcD/ProY family transporter n=1 Tax=Brevibacillus migulae TaxID=1644114 RepID=UPI001430018F|nr:endospore germination permease [Brevibacillus migulae]